MKIAFAMRFRFNNLLKYTPVQIFKPKLSITLLARGPTSSGRVRQRSDEGFGI